MYRSNYSAVSAVMGRAACLKAFSGGAGTTCTKIAITSRWSLAATCAERFTAFSRRALCRFLRRNYTAAYCAAASSGRPGCKITGVAEAAAVSAAALSFSTTSPSTASAVGQIFRVTRHFSRSATMPVSLAHRRAAAGQGR